MTTPRQNEVDQAVTSAEAGLLAALHAAFDMDAGLAAVKNAARGHTRDQPHVVGPAGLLAELQALCKGRGLHSAGLSSRVGPGLRMTCGITDEDSEELSRSKVSNRLSPLVQRLPEDMALAVQAGLGLSPAAQHPLLRDRIEWLADQLNRDRRTAWRRMDSALVRLAQAAADLATASPGPAPAAGAEDGWYVQEFHAVLRLDRPTPEATERRIMVAEHDGVDRIVARLTVPRDPADRTSTPGLLMEVLHGAVLASEDHDGSGRMRFVLKLPRPLRAGERHEYALRFRLLHRQLVRTHYLFTSAHRCDVFDLRIHFDPEHPPEQIWRISELPHLVATQDEPPDDSTLTLHATNQLQLRFQNLAPDHTYGIRWTEIDAAANRLHDASAAIPARPRLVVATRSGRDTHAPTPEPAPSVRGNAPADPSPADLETAIA
jgi:hypothetical protein